MDPVAAERGGAWPRLARDIFLPDGASLLGALLRSLSKRPRVIGMKDDGTVVGVECDLETFDANEQDLDTWPQSLEQAVVNSLGAEVWSVLRLSLEPFEAGTVAVVECPRRDGPSYLTAGGEEEFYCRAASATQALPLSRAVTYIIEHWPNWR